MKYLLIVIFAFLLMGCEKEEMYFENEITLEIPTLLSVNKEKFNSFISKGYNFEL